MNKRDKAISFLIMEDFVEKPKSFIGIVAKNIINYLISEFDRLEIEHRLTIRDIREYDYDDSRVRFFRSVCLLQAQGLLEARHVKELIKYHFKHGMYDASGNGTGYYLTDAIINSKILDEADDTAVINLIIETLKQNQNILKDLKNGKDKAIGSIVGIVMRTIRTDPVKLKILIMSEVEKL